MSVSYKIYHLFFPYYVIFLYVYAWVCQRMSVWEAKSHYVTAPKYEQGYIGVCKINFRTELQASESYQLFLNRKTIQVLSFPPLGGDHGIVIHLPVLFYFRLGWGKCLVSWSPSVSLSYGDEANVQVASGVVNTVPQSEIRHKKAELILPFHH